jgi:hypothetical protein
VEVGDGAHGGQAGQRDAVQVVAAAGLIPDLETKLCS